MEGSLVDDHLADDDRHLLDVELLPTYPDHERRRDAERRLARDARVARLAVAGASIGGASPEGGQADLAPLDLDLLGRVLGAVVQQNGVDVATLGVDKHLGDRAEWDTVAVQQRATTKILIPVGELPV